MVVRSLALPGKVHCYLSITGLCKTSDQAQVFLRSGTTCSVTVLRVVLSVRFTFLDVSPQEQDSNRSTVWPVLTKPVEGLLLWPIAGTRQDLE